MKREVVWANSDHGFRRLRQRLLVVEAEERGGRQAVLQGRRSVAEGNCLGRPDDADELAGARRGTPHRHQSLLRQSGPAPEPERQFHGHELVPVRAPSLPARRVRGHGLPATHRAAEELGRHPHGDGCARPTHPRHLLRRVRHSLCRCRLHAGVAPPALACTAHGDLLQRPHGRPVHGDMRCGNPRGRSPVTTHRRPADRTKTRGAPSRRLCRALLPSRPCARTSSPKSPISCAPPMRPSRSRRWQTVACACWVTRRRSAPPGVVPAASAIC